MKKTLVIIIALVLTFMALKAIQTYKINATVSEVHGIETTFIDEEGNEWIVKNDSFKVGDNVVLTMNDCDTPQIEDDFIVNVKVER